MHQNVFYLGLLAATVPVMTTLVWLLGLVITLRGSRPRERAALLRAYGSSFPRFRPRCAPASEG